jgi:hypothetical protein
MTSRIVSKVQPRLHTNGNESFNHLKTRFLDKDMKYSTSQVMRLEVAIRQWNEPANWQADLRDRRHLRPLPNDVQSQIDSVNSTAIGRNLLRRTRALRRQINTQRALRRRSQNRYEQEGDGYGPQASAQWPRWGDRSGPDPTGIQ